MEKRKRKSGRETEGKGSLCLKYVTVNIVRNSDYCLALGSSKFLLLFSC